RQTSLSNCFHHVTKPVQLAKSGVDVRRDTNALKLFVDDWCGKDSVCAEEIAADRGGLNTLNLDIRNSARLLRIKRRIEANSGQTLQAIHPVARQVTQSRFLSLHTDA